MHRGMRDSNPGVRAAALTEMIGDTLNVVALESEIVRSLADGSPLVRVAAVRALASLPASSSFATTSLRTLATDADSAVRVEALQALYSSQHRAGEAARPWEPSVFERCKQLPRSRGC